MANAGLWLEILKWLRERPEYSSGVIVEMPELLGGERRAYQIDYFLPDEFLGLFSDASVLTLEDIFPSNPNR